MTVQPLQPAATPNEPDKGPSAQAVLDEPRRGSPRFIVSRGGHRLLSA